jgi:hypothetical protein
MSAPKHVKSETQELPRVRVPVKVMIVNNHEPMKPLEAEAAGGAELTEPSLPTLGRDDEPSITGIHGHGARFAMAYSPPTGERIAYGPPVSQRWPSMVYCTLAIAVLAVVLLGYAGSSNSRLYVWVVEGDRGRPLPAWVLASIIFASGIATVMRARMRGVVVSSEGLEARYLMALGIPRVQKWTWPQMDRFVVDSRRVMVELWNGSRVVLPAVSDLPRLVSHLESIAQARKKDVTHLRDLPR